MAKVHRADPNITAMNIHRFETGNYGKPNEANLIMADDMQKRKDNQRKAAEQAMRARKSGLVRGKDYATSGRYNPSNPYFSDFSYENLSHTNEQFKDLSQEQRLDNNVKYTNVDQTRFDLFREGGLDGLPILGNIRNNLNFGMTPGSDTPPVAETPPTPETPPVAKNPYTQPMPNTRVPEGATPQRPVNPWQGGVRQDGNSAIGEPSIPPPNVGLEGLLSSPGRIFAEHTAKEGPPTRDKRIEPSPYMGQNKEEVQKKWDEEEIKRLRKQKRRAK